MTSRAFRKYLFFSTIILLLMAVNTNVASAQIKREELVEKLKEVEKLIHQSKAEGKDTSRAEELKKASRRAAESGDAEGCSRLLKEAIALLKGRSEKEIIPKAETSKKVDRTNLQKKRAELSVNTPSVFVTQVVPAYDSGKGISYSNAFDSQRLESKNGRVLLEVSSIPIIVEEAKNGIPEKHLSRKDYEASPFGIHGIESDYQENLAYLPELGAKWTRYAGVSSVIWDMVEPEKGKFDWSRNDELYLKTYKQGINMLVNLVGVSKWDQSVLWGRPVIKMPVHMDAYKQFVQKTVERYDGDGIDDAPGSPVINYWQIGNEIDLKMSWTDTRENFCELLKISYEVIKQANPSAKVVFAGFTGPGGYYGFYRYLFDYMSKKYPGKRFFDVIDLHWSGQFKGTYRQQPNRGVTYEMKNFISDLRQQFKEIGYGYVPLWITEMSDYDGNPVADPIDGEFPLRPELEHAMSLFKLYIYSISQGVEKAFWVTLKEWHDWGGRGRVNNYFDSVGLVHNPKTDGLSHRKLAFFTYKLMADKLDGADFKNTEILQLGENIYAYKFLRDGKFVYVLWYDK